MVAELSDITELTIMYVVLWMLDKECVWKFKLEKETPEKVTSEKETPEKITNFIVDVDGTGITITLDMDIIMDIIITDIIETIDNAKLKGKKSMVIGENLNCAAINTRKEKKFVKNI